MTYKRMERDYAEAADKGIPEGMIDAAIDAWNDVHDMDTPPYVYAIAVIEAVKPMIQANERTIAIAAWDNIAAMIEHYGEALAMAAINQAAAGMLDD